MKIKNIAFSGFAAAIFAAGAANAAPQIASKTYVDNTVETLEATIDSTYTKTSELSDKVAQNISDALKDSTSELATAIDAKADASSVTELSEKVDGFDADISTKADKVKDVTEANAGGIATVAAGGNYVMSDTKLEDLASKDSVEQLGETVAGHTSTLSNLSTTIGSAVDTAIDTSIKSGDLKTELDKKANSADVYTKEATDAKIIDLAIPMPSAECQANSGHCVLSVVTGSNGKTGLSWVPVTEPFDGGTTSQD